MQERIKRLYDCMRLGIELLHEFTQIVYGMYQITRLPHPCVTIFGGSRISSKSDYAIQAHLLAESLVKANIAVLTGGGTGIMEAANCGAAHHNTAGVLMSMSIEVSGLVDDQPRNCFGGKTITLDYFFARKWLLINYSVGFCIFPGGIGTLDELADVMNLMDTNKRARVPVVLFGREFWKPYLAYLEQSRMQGLLSDNSPVLFVTDDIQEAVTYLISGCAECQ